MSIINCKQFKKKHYRTIDNPRQDEQINPTTKMQTISKHNFTFRRQDKQISRNIIPNTMKRSSKQCLEEKEENRKTVNAHESSLNKSITNEQTQGSINKQQKKKKIFRYLKTEIEPASNKNIYTSQMNTSLIKSKKSSTQSLRIHKIKSIISLQSNHQKLPIKNVKQAKAYRYQDSLQKQQQTASKDSLMKTIVYRRKMIVQKKEVHPIPIEVQTLKRQFKLLNSKMQEIQIDTPENIIKNHYLQTISSIIAKNVKLSVNIMTRFMSKKIKEKGKLGWQQLQINSLNI